MPQDNFTRLDAKQAAAILRDVNAVCDGSGFEAATTTVLAQPLSFFPGWRLLDVANFTVMPPERCYVVYRPGAAVILDGTNGPVYRLAREAPVSLDTDKVPDYIRFFLRHVGGRQGRFILAESVEDIPWLGDPPSPLRKEVGRRIMPLIAERTENGYRLAATLLVGNGLFAAEIDVAADGVVGIGRQELLIEDLAVRDAVLDA